MGFKGKKRKTIILDKDPKKIKQITFSRAQLSFLTKRMNIKIIIRCLKIALKCLKILCKLL